MSRQGDKETRRQGDKEMIPGWGGAAICCQVRRWFFSLSPCLLVSLSPCLLAAGPVPPPGTARPSPDLPPEVAGLAFDQRLNAQVPLDADFRDEGGRTVRLGDFV